MDVNQIDSLVEVAPPSNQASFPAAPVEIISNQDQAISSQPDTKPSTLMQLSETAFTLAHAGPSVRRFARELGVNLNLVSGSGKKKRILKDDVKAYVKDEISKSPGSGNNLELNLLPWPQVDFAKFGPVKLKPLLRIQKMSGANLHRNWVMIPHVTQFDEADVTDLEVERKKFNKFKRKDGAKLTILAFLMEAAVAALKEFPDFNASLDRESGDINLVIKNYYHIGFAVDTSHGLMVPVIPDADQKNIVTIAKEMGDVAERAREGKLKPTEMQGASFTISSLGGIGGTAFTPIINAPEVAILGASRANIKPVYRDGQFVPRLILPLSLSYDHRVIDGASAARFTTYIVKELANMSQVLL
jgi:pyruvate dehydrogenase E2 component (dihydrolipoamide acetyltransferase)